MATSQKSDLVERKIRENSDATYAYLKDKLLFTYQNAVSTMETIKGAVKALENPENDTADVIGILSKKHAQLVKLTTDMKKLVEPLAAADVMPVYEINPPVEVFYNWNRYIVNHYEQLREAVKHLYNDKPDLEYAVIYYDHFKNKEKARDHRNAHADEFKTEVLTISNNGVSLIGPFKENRERVDYYNKHTEIMKRLMEQMESDHKLGKDLMEKEVKKKKAKNIAEAGPDAPGLAAYAKTGPGSREGTVQELGAKKVLTREDHEKLLAEQREKEQADTPDDAIQVEMFYPQTDAEGNTVLEKTHFYSQAEAPLHMQEGSAFTEQYQPKREEGKRIESALTTKTIVDRHGNKVEVKDLRKK
jgi:hypothetical protein